jgi:hypothetical protein
MHQSTLVTVYWSGDDLVRVDPDNVTTAGVHVSACSITALEAPSDTTLGEALYEAFRVAGSVVRHPAQNEWSSLRRAHLKALNAPSWQQFQRENAAALVMSRANGFEIQPMRAVGHRRGYEDMSDGAVLVSANVSPSTFGAAVREAIARSRDIHRR